MVDFAAWRRTLVSLQASLISLTFLFVMRIAFITNFCPHYRIKTFEEFSKGFSVDYYFFSAGDDWYWQQQNGIHTGSFHFEYLHGISIGYTRITPSLPLKLLFGSYDIYIKCINGRFALPITYAIAKLRGNPFILWTGVWMRLQTPIHKILFPITQYIYRNADAVVVYGEHVKKYLIEEGVPQENIFVAAHAIDNNAYNKNVPKTESDSLRLKLNISPDKKIVLYLGRLEQAKGLSVLLEAFSLIKDNDVILLFAGSGTYRDELEKQALQKNISGKVRFAGYVPTEEAVLYYSLAFVYILPSITTDTFKEPWGLVVNEAFNQGVPVIATDAVGAAAGGLIQDGINGYIVKERSAQEISLALNKLLNDTQRYKTLSENAKKVIAGWNNKHMVMGFAQAIEYVQNKQKIRSKKNQIGHNDY